jgi:hypothetical protein
VETIYFKAEAFNRVTSRMHRLCQIDWKAYGGNGACVSRLKVGEWLWRNAKENEIINVH